MVLAQRYVVAQPHEPSPMPGSADHLLFPRALVTSCPCGGNHGVADHDAQQPAGAEAAAGESAVTGAIHSAVLRAVIPDPLTRRVLVRAVGARTALAALRDVLPLRSATSLTQSST